MVDCILAYAANVLVDKMTDPKREEGREMLDLVKADARASKQFLLLAHLYVAILFSKTLLMMTRQDTTCKDLSTIISVSVWGAANAMMLCAPQVFQDRCCKSGSSQARAAEAAVHCN